METLWILNDDNKGEKQKPVVHCMASVSTSCLIWLHPERIDMGQCDMLKDTVTALCPQRNASIRKFFIDHSYLNILKNQNKDNVTNLVQLLLRIGIKFLGTFKN